MSTLLQAKLSAVIVEVIKMGNDCNTACGNRAINTQLECDRLCQFTPQHILHQQVDYLSRVIAKHEPL